MIVYRSRFLTRAEVWYDDEPKHIRSVDWILYNLRSSPVAGYKWRYFYNYCIDLTQDTELLRTRLHKDAAYKIRRACERDKTICESCDQSDPAVLDRFEEMYNSFAMMKGLSPLNRVRLNSMADAGALDMSLAKDAHGNILVSHANYRDPHRASHLHSPSLYPSLSDSAARNLIGRANRYLFWSNILRYKEQGLKWFDFGGWYPGTTDSARLNINEFKKGFGGKVTREYECERILTLKGWSVLQVARILKQARLFPFGSKTPAAQSPPPETQNSAAAASA